LPHSPWSGPLEKQYGFALDGHASIAPEPSSPLQATHVDVVALHTGVAPVHAAGSAGVHCTHVLVCVSQTGVAPLHCASDVQPPLAAHVPFGPHVPERQTVPPSPVVQGPSPFA
jgi:hypothetical protein